MRRRQFLALVGTGLVAGTAGCAGLGNSGDSQTNTSETTESTPDTGAKTTAATETSTTTARETPLATMNGETTNPTTGQRMATSIGTTGNGAGGRSDNVAGQITTVPDGLKITKQWFYRKQFSTGVRGIIKNVSGSPFDYVEIRAAFYNAQGKRIDVGIDHVTDLAPGDKWPFEVPYEGSRDPSRIVRYTLVVDTSPV